MCWRAASMECVCDIKALSSWHNGVFDRQEKGRLCLVTPHSVVNAQHCCHSSLSVSSAGPQAYQGFLCFLSAHAHPSCVSVLSVCNWGEESVLQRSQHEENCNGLCRKTDPPLGFISRHKCINLASTHWSAHVYTWDLFKSLKDVIMCSTSWLLYFICT